VHWRVAFYVAGPKEKLLEFFETLREFVKYVADKPEFKSKGLLPKTRIMSTDASFMETADEHLRSIGWEPLDGNQGLHPFDAYPPKGKRGVMVTADMTEDNKCVHLLFSGNLWQFRNRFDALDIAGGYVEQDDAQREYVRIIRNLRVDHDEDWEMVKSVLGNGVLFGCPVLLVADDIPQESAQDMLRVLTKFPNIFVR